MLKTKLQPVSGGNCAGSGGSGGSGSGSISGDDHSGDIPEVAVMVMVTMLAVESVG